MRRIATRPTAAAKRRRLQTKAHRGRIKQSRGAASDEDESPLPLPFPQGSGPSAAPPARTASPVLSADDGVACARLKPPGSEVATGNKHRNRRERPEQDLPFDQLSP